MKHPSSQALYDYWNERRGSRAAPERGDIEPGAIHHALGDSFIIAFDPLNGHRFRLAGTRICGLFGRELKGHALRDLWEAADRPPLLDIVTIVADETLGVVAGATGRTSEGYTIDIEVLLLPLRHRGHTHARQIGILAPLSLPYWLGSSPVVALKLRSFRHIGMVDAAVETKFTSLHGRRLRNGLVVYDGGRT